MKINKNNALRIWYEQFGECQYAKDFHGKLMCRDAYGDEDFYVERCWKKTYCGWNIHHILPLANGGTNEKSNLICTNIITNEEAGDKTTFRIDDTLYQVRRIPNSSRHEIIKKDLTPKNVINGFYVPTFCTAPYMQNPHPSVGTAPNVTHKRNAPPTASHNK